MKELYIIGGGASGLISAISAFEELKRAGFERRVSISILERKDKVGRKLLATGNGRCNLTNKNMDIKFYYSDCLEAVDKVISDFDISMTIEFFEGLGLMTRCGEEGKIYPYSLQASSVLDVLRGKAGEYGINEICSSDISRVSAQREEFILKDRGGKTYRADSVIMAPGGCASPNLGSDGSGFKLMTELGHKLNRVFPAITQIKTETDVVKSIQGIKVEGALDIVIDGVSVRRETGEILFTEYGISGPAVFKVARLVGDTVGKNKHKNILAVIDLMPEIDKDSLLEILKKRVEIFKNKNMDEFMTGTVNKRIGQTIVKMSGLRLSDPVLLLDSEKMSRLCNNIKGFTLKCIGTQSFQNAQVTAGGISLKEFDKETLQSRLVRGLFACGEILDADGECGGYNLQWAWSSGYKAGKHAAEYLIRKNR